MCVCVSISLTPSSIYIYPSPLRSNVSTPFSLPSTTSAILTSTSRSTDHTQKEYYPGGAGVDASASGEIVPCGQEPPHSVLSSLIYSHIFICFDSLRTIYMYVHVRRHIYTYAVYVHI